MLAEKASNKIHVGRWLTPDAMGGDVTNPQSLNRYAYVLNNPTTLTDPLGLDPPPGQLYQQFRAHCLIYPACARWATIAGTNAMGWDIFSVMQIPVVASEWVPTQFTQSGNNLYMTTGHWEVTQPDTSPDFYQFAVNVGGIVGLTFTVTVSRNAHWYFGAGPNLGKSATLVSGSLTPGWVFNRPHTYQPASPAAVSDFLTKYGCSAGGGFGTGAFYNWTNTAKGVTAGAVTPQVGVSCTYSWRIR